MTVSPKTDAVSASVSGVAWWKTPLRAGEIGVDAVAELVRQREHVAPACRPVQQDVRVVRRHRVRAEGAGTLPRPHRGIDPCVVEEALHDVGDLRREGRVRVEHEVTRVGPAERVLGLRDRCRAVVVGQAIEPEQPCLEGVPALWDVVAGDDGVDERADRLVARLVVEVPARDPVAVAPQAVVHRLVREQRVEHERSRPEPGLEGRGDCLGRLPPTLTIRGLQPREPLFEAHGLTVDVDLDRGRQLAEQARPGAATGRGLVGEQSLLRLGQQMRAVAARRRQMVATERERVVGEDRGDVLLGQLRPFELDEQELVRDRGGALLGASEQRTTGGILGVDREAQARIRTGAAEELGDAGELVHELGETSRIELADATSVGGERAGTLLRLVEQLLDARVALPVDERLDVPRDAGGGTVVVVDGHGVGGHVGEPTTPRPARPWVS